MDKKYWQLQPNSLFDELKTSAKGLSSEEASARQRINGRNEIVSDKKRSAFQIFLSQFTSPLLIVLAVAAVVSGFLGDPTSAVIIILIIVFSSVISFFQEYKSEKTLDLLKKKITLKSQVIRDGRLQSIYARDLVVGDLAVLSFGNIVPADLRMIEESNLSINESSLTGESFPVSKTSEARDTYAYLPQAMDNLAFMGTYVVQGYGKGIVVATGKDTEFGRTAKLVSEKQEVSQFQKGISDFSVFLFKIIIVFSFIVFLTLALLRGNWLEALLFALSVAVGISPELLPMIITINLSGAARKMAKKNVLVKKLISIEDLGNADILCTDKTGTLTEGKISLKDFLDFSGEQDLRILQYANLCNSLSLSSVANNPLDEATVEYVKKMKEDFSSLAEAKFKVIDDIAFDFERRKTSVIVQNNERMIITKGAEEEMIKSSKYVLWKGKKEPVSGHLEEMKSRITFEEGNGFKTLLLGYKEIGVKDKYSPEDESDLILLGYLVFSDPPKKTAAKSLEVFEGLGVAVKLLTGDTEESARFLARQVGIGFDAIILGSEIEDMSDEALQKAVNNYDIFAKTTPELKLRIVKAFKESGHRVAFMGDGINDAPALRNADVGISVDSATDVAKEAADVILLKRNLEVLADGIREGRKTFGNTIKYIYCTISSSYGNMFSVVVASLFLPFIPLLPVQVLLLNFLTDFPLLAISTDSVDDEYLKKPKHWDIGKIRESMNYFGLLSSLFDFITFGFLLFLIHASVPMFQVGWFWESFLTEVFLIFNIRTKGWFWKSKPSKPLLIACLITLFIVLSIMYSPVVGYFGFARMPLWTSLSLLSIAILYFIVVELSKKRFYRKYDI